MLVSEIINEQVHGGVHLVYHSTIFEEIFDEGIIRGKTTCVINGKKVRGISFTRSMRFAKAFQPIVLGLDRAKLAQRFRIVPFADSTIGISDYIPGDARREAEDFLIANQIPLDDFLVGIWLNTEERTHPEYRDIPNHPLFKGWFDPV